ncbi:MAG TPA: metal ABC transporter permease [Thermoanaerobaculia bacterium]|nr:metal ABC transporter permease [Thermoanaerobaculia bacterium]
MGEAVDLLSYGFIRNAVVAGLLAAVLCGVVGTFVVVKRLVFLAGGVAHAAFGGLGICYFLGVDPRLGAAAAAVVSALALANAGGPGGGSRSHDARIGILWAVGMALGVVFIYKIPGYAPNLMAYLFGNILTVRESDVLLTLGVTVVVAALFLLFFKESVALAFDEEFAAVQGVPVRTARTVLMLLTALSVVFLLQLVGIVLVIALLTIPPVVALRFAGGFGAVVGLSIAIGVAMTQGGLALSYLYDLPSGPAIVLLGAALLALVDVGRRAFARRRTET